MKGVLKPHTTSRNPRGDIAPSTGIYRYRQKGLLGSEPHAKIFSKIFFSISREISYIGFSISTNTMRAFLDTLNVIVVFTLTTALILTLWYIPGPNAVLKEDVIRHGGAHWELTSTGKTLFIWNK